MYPLSLDHNSALSIIASWETLSVVQLFHLDKAFLDFYSHFLDFYSHFLDFYSHFLDFYSHFLDFYFHFFSFLLSFSCQRYIIHRFVLIFKLQYFVLRTYAGIVFLFPFFTLPFIPFSGLLPVTLSFLSFPHSSFLSSPFPSFFRSSLFHSVFFSPVFTFQLILKSARTYFILYCTYLSTLKLFW